MSIERAGAYLEKFGLKDKIMVTEQSSATVELAAKALNCEEARIAKSISFYVEEKVVLVVTSGDMKIDNKKFKNVFQVKAKMLSHEDALPLIGHDVGGVCPFGVNDGVDVYLDESLKRFATIFPACGSSNSMIELTPDELDRVSGSKGWIDVCKSKGD